MSQCRPDQVGANLVCATLIASLIASLLLTACQGRGPTTTPTAAPASTSPLLTGTGGTEKDRLLEKTAISGGARLRFEPLGAGAAARAVLNLRPPAAPDLLRLAGAFVPAALAFTPTRQQGALVYELSAGGATRRFLVSESELGPDRGYRLEIEGLSAGESLRLSADSELYANARSKLVSLSKALAAGGNEASLSGVPALVDDFGRPPIVQKRRDPQALYPGDDVSFLANVTVPDNLEVLPGASFEKVWALQNAGNRVWDDRSVLHHSPGGCSASEELRAPAQSLPFPRAFPGEVFVLRTRMTAPTMPGTYLSAWRYQQANGTQVFPGLPGMRAQIRVATPAADIGSGLRLTPVYRNAAGETVPVPENLAIAPDAPFALSWRVHNAGTSPTPAYRLVQLDRGLCPDAGYLLPTPAELSVPALEPGKSVDLALSLSPPRVATTVRSSWELRTRNGGLVGPRAYVQLTIDQAWPLRGDAK